MTEHDPDLPQTPPPAWRAFLLRWKPWILAGVTFVLALVAAITLWGKLRTDVWAYYTDGKDLQADVDDERARPVLWEDPRQHHFDEPAREAAEAPSSSANAPTGKLEASFSADGTMMVLVRWQSPGTNAEMYLSQWDGRKWSKPEPIQSINTEANERSPALSRDGRYLYFASDRNGGLGGYDLYVARWNGQGWVGIEPLPAEVNSSSDELGPALSADESHLFFSTNRDGADDIYLSKVSVPEAKGKRGEDAKKGKQKRSTKGKRKAAEIGRADPGKAHAPAPVPKFALAEPAHDLNSKASDIEAAATERGDHVFLASDRDRSKKLGYKVYWSRVVDGEVQAPEEVDLYIEQGDITDPAVRMDGFDLLFSSSAEPAASGEVESPESKYLLYRSTTREVFGYTDLSRWEQFKELMGNIAWWILLAIAALIALVYILEKWQDITSLYHKCLAGSAALHLLWLFLAMVWLIAKQVEEEDKNPYEDVVISIDALSEEELAMESIPDSAALTDASTSIEIEKTEAEFGAPGFEAPDENQPIPDAAQTAKEALLVEAEATVSEPIEPPISEPVEPTNLLEALAETSLPEVDQPLLEERDPSEPQPVADTSEDLFEPEQPTTEPVKADAPTLTEAVVEAPVEPMEVTEATPPEPLVEAPKESVLEPEFTETQPPEEQTTETEPLESAMLAALPESEFVDPSATPLEETDPANPTETAPANPSQEVFEPSEVVPNVASAPAESSTIADAAVPTAADASAVAPSEIAASAPVADAIPAAPGEAASTNEVPAAEFSPLAASDLPSPAMLDAPAPALDEGGAAAIGAPADTSQDVFSPAASAADLATAPAQSQNIADAAVPTAADASSVTSAEMVAGSPAVEVRPPTMSDTTPINAMPPSPIAAAPVGALPEPNLLDAGAPKLEERGESPAAGPANTATDMFTPSSAVAKLNSGPTTNQTVADAAKPTAADASAVASGTRVPSSTAVEAVPPEAIGTTAANTIPPSPLEAAPMSALPSPSLVDPGTPKLEERGENPAAGPANTATDMFKPSSAVAKLNTAPTGSQTVADAAKPTAADASAVASGTRVPSSTAVEARPPEAIGSTAANAVPPSPLEAAPMSALPSPSLVDPGAPKLEERGDNPAAGPADPSKDQFKPTGGIPNLATAPAQSKDVPDTVASGQSDASAVTSGARVAKAAGVEAMPPEAREAPQADTVPPAPTTPGAISALPDIAPIDPGAPKLEEPGKQPGKPADTSKDKFVPGGSVPNLATSKAGSRAIADSATAAQASSEAVAGGQLDAAAAATSLAGALESPATVPTLDAGAEGPRLDIPTSLPTPGLPSKLDAPKNITPGDLAKEIQKQRGKPGIDTIKQMGGSEGTEGSIGSAIAWLVKNQESDGRWDTRKHGANQNYDTGGTGLALLCFYGWGERHDKKCKYQKSVRDGINWLITRQDKDGYLGGRPGMMYSHAIAAIALCEAYGITKDKKLRAPAERAIAYTLAAQSPAKGGWRYSPGNDSDTSVTGWQYMALHSARMAGLKVPQENFDRARKFLDNMGGGKHGGLYGYQERGKLSRAMVATGMFCRQLDLVPPSHPMQQESARLLKLHNMKTSNPDLYYVYYATLALYQHQGPIWTAWNERLKETLPLIQNKTGNDAGSWSKSASMTADGGKVVSTAMATLSLEVYYRLLPMYGFRNTEADAPEKEKRE